MAKKKSDKDRIIEQLDATTAHVEEEYTRWWNAFVWAIKTEETGERNLAYEKVLKELSQKYQPLAVIIFTNQTIKCLMQKVDRLEKQAEHLKERLQRLEAGSNEGDWWKKE